MSKFYLQEGDVVVSKHYNSKGIVSKGFHPNTYCVRNLPNEDHTGKWKTPDSDLRTIAKGWRKPEDTRYI